MSNHHVLKTQEELAALFRADITTGVGRSVKHESADKHVSGEAVYVDDRLEFPNQLHVYARMSDRAHARIVRIDTAPCYQIPGMAIAITSRSEERRVGKECRSRWSPVTRCWRTARSSTSARWLSPSVPTAWKPHARRPWRRPWRSVVHAGDANSYWLASIDRDSLLLTLPQ